MKKIIWTIIVIVVIVLIVWAVSGTKNDTVSTNETIKIGGNLALTSYGASWGENQLKGAQLAVKEINAKGGVLGRKLELVTEDNKTEPKTTVTVANKLISTDKVSFMLTGWSKETEPIIPIIDQNKIITITVSAGAPGITKKSQYLFRTWPSDGIAVNRLVEYAQSKGYKKIGFAHTIASWENSLTDLFKQVASTKGILASREIAFTIDTQDYKTQISDLKAQNPDAVFLATGPGPLERFIKQARDLGLNVPFLYPVDVVTLGLPEQIAPTYLKNMVYAIYTPSKDQFVSAFKKEYNLEPGVSADTSYDAVYMIARAIEKAGTMDTEKVRTSFETLEGASGTITFNADRDRTDAQVILMTFDGKSKTSQPLK